MYVGPFDLEKNLTAGIRTHIFQLTRNMRQLISLERQVDELRHLDERLRVDRPDAVVVERKTFESREPERVVLDLQDPVEAQVQDPELRVGLAVEGASLERGYLVVLWEKVLFYKDFCDIAQVALRNARL